MRPWLSLVILGMLSLPAWGQEPIKFARTPDVSPDGKLVAFSYLGDIWTVEAIGGVARPVTMHEAHDYFPCFSPDGRYIAFSSNRHGSYDVFVVPVQGGKPKRLTFDSASDVVTGWTPDGKSVVFSSTRSTGFPYQQEVYTVPFEGGQERRLNLFEGKEAYFSPDGKHLAFVRGPGTWFRKGYRGASQDDVWISRADGTDPRRLTSFEGQDISPMWSPDGKRVYYVSEHLSPKRGCSNIIAQDVNLEGRSDPAEGLPRLITHHETDSVRRARISDNGEWIVYECGADLWMVGTRGGSARKLAIEVHADDKSNAERTVTLTRDATEFALSPSEDHAVVVVHGELFLTAVPGGGKATRLTDHPGFDHAPRWAPDGKSILFASDRSGVEDLYLLEPDDPEHPTLTKAHKFKVRPLTQTREEESAATFSPKGDRIAFIRAGQLWLIKPDGTNEKVLVDETKVLDYDWSPDGKWLVYSRMDGSFASELYVVPVDGSAPSRNVTRYATWNGEPSWSETGGKIAFVGHRRGSYTMMVLSLFRPGSGKSTEIEWEDIHKRVTRPSMMSADSGVISPDGSQVAFRSIGNGQDDLWVASSDGGGVGRVTSGNQRPRQITWARKSSGTIFFLADGGELKSTRSSYGSFTGSSGPSSDPTRITFQATLTIRKDEEFAEMFAQSWRHLSDAFYDPMYHGVDWKAVRAKYAPLVAHIGTREDLYALIHLMLGELNASHVGIGGKLPVADDPTAELGLIFDENYRGPGFKIAEILKRGPADRRGLNLAFGDIIRAIDRTELTDATNLSRLLNGKAGETVTLEIAPGGDPMATRKRIEITPAKRTTISQLRYERWVDQNAAEVARLSGNTIGYIHIPSMDEDGLETFVRSLYSDQHDKQAILIDVRFNGGGFTHDQVLNYLAGKEHTLFRQRNGGEGGVFRNYDRKWTRPAAVLINNRSYSDAEIFPHAFRTMGLGRLIGQHTGGQVIGTSEVKLIDGSWFNVPKTGIFTRSGTNLEKEGIKPDVLIENDERGWASGTDQQLRAGVEALQDDVAAWRIARGLLAYAPPPRLVPPPMTVTAPPPMPMAGPGGR